MRKKKGARTRETSRIKNHHLHFPIVISCYTSFFLSFCVESTRKKKKRSGNPSDHREFKNEFLAPNRGGRAMRQQARAEGSPNE